MALHPFRALFASTTLVLAAGCATTDYEMSTANSARDAGSSERDERAESASPGERSESARESVAASEVSRTREAAGSARGSREAGESLRDREAVSPARERAVAELRGERAATAETPRASSSEGRAIFSASSLNTMSASSAENAKLVAQLNEASRELAALRAANARLSAERPRATATREAAPRSDPVDDRIAASVRSYAQFKQELTALMSEAEKARSEHAALNDKLKDAVTRAEEARAALARAESDLRKEKKARADAEQAAAKLREQLRAIARAVSGTGVNLDKLADGSTGK